MGKSKSTSNESASEAVVAEVSEKLGEIRESADGNNVEITVPELFGNTMFNAAQIKMLSAHLNPKNVKSNPTGHAYIEGYFAIAMANAIFGFGNWQYEARDFSVIQEEHLDVFEKENGNMIPIYKTDAAGNKVKTGKYKTRPQIHVGYRVKIEVTVYNDDHTKSVVFSDFGYGNGNFGDRFKAHESAGKEAVTDGFKRCLRAFGNQFGNALYDKKKTMVSDDPNAPNIDVSQLETQVPQQKATAKTLPAQSGDGAPPVVKKTTNIQSAHESAPEATKKVERHNVLKALQQMPLKKKVPELITPEDCLVYKKLMIEYGKEAQYETLKVELFDAYSKWNREHNTPAVSKFSMLSAAQCWNFCCAIEGEMAKMYDLPVPIPEAQ